MASPINITVEVDTDAFEGKMRGFVKQVPFAYSLALNKTAKVAIKDMRADIRHDRDFTIRGPWVPGGIRMRGSNKQNLVATVGSVDEFMVRQAEGGTKTDKDGGSLAIPLIGKGRARARLRKTTPQSMWPSQLPQNDPDVFVGMAGYKAKKGGKKRRKTKRYNKVKGFTNENGGTYAVWRRLPKHRLRMVYAFKKQVEIKGRWNIKKVVAASVAEHWPDEARKAIEYAIKTAKR